MSLDDTVMNKAGILISEVKSLFTLQPLLLW